MSELNRKPRIAVVGASGAVGEVMLSILAERGHREDRVTALASERSAGQEVDFGATQLTVENLAEFDFSSTDYALFSAGGSVSKEFAPAAAAAGAGLAGTAAGSRCARNSAKASSVALSAASSCRKHPTSCCSVTSIPEP